MRIAPNESGGGRAYHPNARTTALTGDHGDGGDERHVDRADEAWVFLLRECVRDALRQLAGHRGQGQCRRTVGFSHKAEGRTGRSTKKDSSFSVVCERPAKATTPAETKAVTEFPWPYQRESARICGSNFLQALGAMSRYRVMSRTVVPPEQSERTEPQMHTDAPSGT